MFLACSSGWEKLLDQWRLGTAFIPSPEEPSRAAPSKGRCYRAFAFHCLALNLGTSTSKHFMVAFITQCAAWLNGQTSATSLLIRQTGLMSFVNSARSSLIYGFLPQAWEEGGWRRQCGAALPYRTHFPTAFSVQRCKTKALCSSLLRACIKKLQCSFRLFHRDSHKSSEGIVQHGQISVGFCPRAKKPTQLSLGDAHGGCCCSVDGLTWELQQLGFRDVKGKRRAGGVNKGSVGEDHGEPAPSPGQTACFSRTASYIPQRLFGRETQGTQHSKPFPQTAQLLDTLVQGQLLGCLHLICCCFLASALKIWLCIRCYRMALEHLLYLSDTAIGKLNEEIRKNSPQ